MKRKLSGNELLWLLIIGGAFLCSMLMLIEYFGGF